MMEAMPCPDHEDEDFEAKDALMSLIRAEEIKDRDEDFLDRVREQISRKIGLLERVREQLPETVTIAAVTISSGDPSQGSRRFEDFLDRIRTKEIEEERRMFEDPKAKRALRRVNQALK